MISVCHNLTLYINRQVLKLHQFKEFKRVHPSIVKVLIDKINSIKVSHCLKISKYKISTRMWIAIRYTLISIHTVIVEVVIKILWAMFLKVCKCLKIKTSLSYWKTITRLSKHLKSSFLIVESRYIKQVGQVWFTLANLEGILLIVLMLV